MSHWRLAFATTVLSLAACAAQIGGEVPSESAGEPEASPEASSEASPRRHSPAELAGELLLREALRSAKGGAEETGVVAMGGDPPSLRRRVTNPFLERGVTEDSLRALARGSDLADLSRSEIFKRLQERLKGMKTDRIIGDDDRVDPGLGGVRAPSRLELSPEDEQDWSKQALEGVRSVALLVEKEDLEDTGDRYRFLKYKTLRERWTLCPGVRFSDQPSAGVGTAFLVHPRLLVTAAHCVPRRLSDYVVIFGYEMGRGNVGYADKKDVYPCTRLVDSEFWEGGPDWALVEVEREVRDRDPLPLGTGRPAKGTQVYMGGYPSGLPLKLGTNSEVRVVDDHAFFQATLDAFRGSSGSPVIDARTHTVEGLLIKDLAGFIPNPENEDCRIIQVIPDTKAVGGAYVMRITDVAARVREYIPPN